MTQRVRIRHIGPLLIRTHACTPPCQWANEPLVLRLPSLVPAQHAALARLILARVNLPWRPRITSFGPSSRIFASQSSPPSAFSTPSSGISIWPVEHCDSVDLLPVSLDYSGFTTHTYCRGLTPCFCWRRRVPRLFPVCLLFLQKSQDAAVFQRVWTTKHPSVSVASPSSCVSSIAQRA